MYCYHQFIWNICSLHSYLHSELGSRKTFQIWNKVPISIFQLLNESFIIRKFGNFILFHFYYEKKGLLPCKHDSIFCNFLLITYYIILDEVLVPDYNHFYRLLFYHTPIYFKPLGLWEFVGHCTLRSSENKELYESQVNRKYILIT